MQLATEKRVASLELKLRKEIASLRRKVRELTERLEQVTQKDWRSVVGMFSGNEAMKEIDEAGRQFREADRAKVRRTAARTNRRSKQ